jgi:hypothetical protein
MKSLQKRNKLKKAPNLKDNFNTGVFEEDRMLYKNIQSNDSVQFKNKYGIMTHVKNLNLTGDIKYQSNMRQMASNVADTGTRTKIIQDAGTGKLNRAVEAFRMEEGVLNEGQIKVGQDNRDLFDSSPENIRC